MDFDRRGDQLAGRHDLFTVTPGALKELSRISEEHQRWLAKEAATPDGVVRKRAVRAAEREFRRDHKIPSDRRLDGGRTWTLMVGLGAVGATLTPEFSDPKTIESHIGIALSATVAAVGCIGVWRSQAPGEKPGRVTS
jgi:hypothetical protein